MLGKIIYYFSWVIKCKIKKQKIPLTSSIIITDKCNLKCKHCTVSNLGYRKLSYHEVIRDIKTLYDMGSRILIITGGEPFLWRDENYTLESVVTFAKKIGFFHIVICTNGTFELESNADYLWVSLDGFPEEHNEIRGNVYNKVLNNILRSKHRNIYINFTISKININNLEKSVKNILRYKKIKGVFFHLFTPYIGSNKELMLNEEERKTAIKKIYKIKKRHPLRVVNTFDGIKVLRDNIWKRPIWSSVVINQGEISSCCCRKGIYDAEVCKNCGCSPAVETLLLQKLKPLVIIENLRFL